MAVNKVKYGDNTLIDLTNDTVTEDTLLQGFTAHNSAGVVITGNATLSEDPVPDYWKTHLNEKIGKIRETMCQVGINKSAFLFYTDSHWSNEDTYTSKKAPMLLKQLVENTPIKKVNYGGDIVSAEGTDSDTMAYLWDWRKQIYGLNHHSVVGNHDDGNTTNNLFSENYVYGYLLAPEETPDVVRESGSMYYYIDVPTEKTRYLYLDTAYKGMSDEQKSFVENSLLSLKENWHIVAIAHQWFTNDYSAYPPTIDGFSNESQFLLNEFDSYNSRNGKYAECLGWVEFCIGGHYHLDYVSKSNGGIPVILIEADTLHDRSGTMPKKNTINEASVSAVVADYNEKVISIIRIGRGTDSEVTIGVKRVSYTNVIPLSIDTSGEIFNSGKGWANNSRIGSGGIYLGNSDSYVTGYIEIDPNINNTIRLRNMTFSKADDNGNRFMGFFDSSFARTTMDGKLGTLYPKNHITEYGGYAPVYDGDNLIEFTLNPTQHTTNKDIKYIAICCGYIGDESVMTINEPIE